METIISYIDNLFRNYPDTPQVRRAREELLGIMEDKYHELKAEGKSENEAIGIVISEFGSMDEIAAALCEEEILHKKEAKTGTGSKNVKNLTREQAFHYLNIQESFGVKIGIGVALCILSPAAACITAAFGSIGLLPSAAADTIGAISLFIMVAIAVGIFITSGISMSKYEDYKKCRIVLDYSTKKEISDLWDAYRRIFGIKIAAGVILCIMSVVPIILIAAIFESTSLFWFVDVSAIGLLGFVAVGVYLFITAGMKQGAFELLLETGKRPPEKSEQADKRIQLIASVYWPLITAGYLVWSFVTMNWGFTWIIWPVAGVIFGGISAVISQL